MDATTVAQVLELRPTGEAVREDDGVGGCGPDRGEQRGLRHRDGHLVVATFEAEVAGQATAPPDPGHGRARGSEQCFVREPAEHSVVVAVGLSDDVGSRQRRRFPAGPGAGQELRQRARGRSDVTGSGIFSAQQLPCIRTEHGGTGRLQPDDGDARSGARGEPVDRAPEDAAGSIELARGDPCQRAAPPR